MSITWFVIRASGLVAYGMLAASVVWGLLLSSGLFGRAIKAKGLTYMHEALAIAGLLATATHMVFLTLDEFVPFSVAELLVPGLDTWSPLATALGVVAMWLTLVITVSFYVRKRIGQKTWRALHYASFGAFISAAVHGIMAGTDTTNPFVMYLYVGSFAVVAGLIVLRIIGLPPDKADRSARVERNLDLAAAKRGAADRQAATGASGRPADDVEPQSGAVATAVAPDRDEAFGKARAAVFHQQHDLVRGGGEGDPER